MAWSVLPGDFSGPWALLRGGGRDGFLGGQRRAAGRVLCSCGRLWLLAAFASGCAASPGSGAGGSLSPPASSSSSAAVAYVGGEPVRAAEFEAALREASGAAVLEEIVLSHLVDQRLARRGLEVEPADVEAERRRLLEALAGEENESERLLTDLRKRRGLGPLRFERLLRRNAGLRKLVAGEVEVTDAAVRRAFDRSHGRRFRVRLLTADTPAQAAALRKRVLAGETFADVAAEGSTDASRDRGGLLDPVHPADPTFPPAIRTAASQLATGELSEVIALASGFGYAVIQLEAILPADGAVFEAEEAAVRGAVRADLERLRMEQAARTLRAEADVLVLDPDLQPDG